MWLSVLSYTFTIEATGGNGIVVPGYGFLLNNELTDFNYDSTTHPNRVEGGKRPRSSMSPTIVLIGGVPMLAVGSPGGSTIITTVVEPAFLNTPEAADLAARGHRLVVTSEIGAVTGIEFLGDGRVFAAAEARRRGGGSAMVENPEMNPN